MYNLVTGAGGFIGFHLSLKLLKKNKRVLGIDNLNDYYDPKIKKERLEILKKYKKFNFIKFDIRSQKNFEKISKYKIDIVYHLAAQAGVRYSFYNPRSYIETNINGFFNILEFARGKKIKRIFFASSSSVYGDKKQFPIVEKSYIKPTSLYGLTKKNNEEIAEHYSKTYNIKIIGLRFFTVFGEYGRPDMFLMKYLNAYKKNRIFYLNNFGKHVRDFTYIKDVINIMINLKFKKSYDVFNICSNNPVTLSRVISLFKQNGVTPKIKKRKFQLGDVVKTHGSNKKVFLNIKKFKITSFELALKKVIKWHNSK